MNTNELQVGTRVYYAGSSLEDSFYGDIVHRDDNRVDVWIEEAEARVVQVKFDAFTVGGRWWLASEWDEALSVGVNCFIHSVEDSNV